MRDIATAQLHIPVGCCPWSQLRCGPAVKFPLLLLGHVQLSACLAVDHMIICVRITIGLHQVLIDRPEVPLTIGQAQSCIEEHADALQEGPI